MTATKKRPNPNANPVPGSAETLIKASELYMHPANSLERTKPEAIAELVESIKTYGQRELVRVRPVESIERPMKPKSGFEVLSGHRRWQACKQLRRAVRCEIVNYDDQEAMREVMLGNAERRDLDPIERAELMEAMIDEGIPRAEAGKMFGLNSESGIKNSLRLLQLPHPIRQMISDGEIPARAARYLVPYAEATEAMNRLAAEFKKDKWLLKRFLENPQRCKPISMGASSQGVDVRPVDGKTKYSPPGYEHKDTPRKFKLDEQTRADLQIVKLPLGNKGKLIEVAQNVTLFDKLNKPHLKKWNSYGESSSRSTKQKKESDAAAEKRKAKEADEKLAKRSQIWARRFKLWCLARQTPVGHAAILSTVIWLYNYAVNWSTKQSLGRQDLIQAAVDSLGGACFDHGDDPLLPGLIACSGDCIVKPGSPDVSHGYVIIDRVWRVMLWPQFGDWPCGEVYDQSVDGLLTENLPTRLGFNVDSPHLDEGFEKILQFADVSLSGGWIDLAGLPAEQSLLSEYLQLHTTKQLEALAQRWKVKYFAGDKAATIRDLIMAAHTEKKPLPIPEVLAPKKGRKKR